MKSAKKQDKVLGILPSYHPNICCKVSIATEATLTNSRGK